MVVKKRSHVNKKASRHGKMPGNKARLYIGTSGWTYASWRGPFYPSDLKSRDYLPFYAREFSTTEVNYSFYHLPKPQTYAHWAEQVPQGFLFSVKASRLITHTKRLLGVEEPWRVFVENAKSLGAHLGPILLQFPPSLKRDHDRLQNFFEMSRCVTPASLRLVCEFRHDSWFSQEVYDLLERYAVALCIADSPTYPRKEVVTTNFAYIRFHGRDELFASRYSEAELAVEAKNIECYLKEGIGVLVYFNNDARGFAIENARYLRSLFQG